MSRHRSHSYIYNVQRIILLIFYTTTSIALSIPLLKLVESIWPGNLFPLIITLIIYLILVVVLGALIHVISFIPFNLASSFDPIKNDLATGNIKNMDQLGKRITSFTVEFFDFSFLDISHAFIQTADSKLISHKEMPNVAKVLEEFEMLDKSKQMEDVIRAGELETPHGKYQLYVLPIWFGNQWLGYMALLSEKRINHFFRRFLNDYENDFLDDPVMFLAHTMKRK